MRDAPSDDANEPQTSRRNVLKRTAALGTLSGAGVLGSLPSATGPALAESSCDGGVAYNMDQEDSASYADGNLITGFTRYSACGQPSIGNWQVTLEINGNAATRSCSMCGVNDEIDDSFIKVTWPEKDDYAVFTDPTNNKFYTGASAAQFSRSSYDYADWAKPAVDYARGRLIEKVPYGDELMVVGETLNQMYQDFAGTDGSQSVEKYKKNFDWSNSYRVLRDVSYWSKYEVTGPTDGSITLSIDNWVNKDYIDSIDMHTQIDFSIFFPSSSPSTVSTMSDEERRRRGFVRVPKAQVAKNPLKWGLTPQGVQKFDDGDIYFHVPGGCSDGEPSREQQLNQARASN